jgi:hypothetical protein
MKKRIHVYINIYLLLHDDFHIGLVISPRVAVLAWGEAECQYSCPRTNIINHKMGIYKIDIFIN